MNKKNFWMAIGGITIGCLMPFLSDKTKTIINLLDYLTNSIKPEKYQKTFSQYNQRLDNFAQHFYFFLVNILNEEEKKYLSTCIQSDGLPSAKEISDAFNKLITNYHLSFARIINEDGSQTFNNYSCEFFKKAEGELNDLLRILQSLPPILDFTRNRYTEFIEIQSGFYQVKNTLCNNAQSQACEAFTEALLKDLISFFKIE